MIIRCLALFFSAYLLLAPPLSAEETGNTTAPRVTTPANEADTVTDYDDEEIISDLELMELLELLENMNTLASMEDTE